MEHSAHFLLMARYNQRMNQQVYAAAGRLTPQELVQERGAFFGSILGTLNHLLVGDLIWLRRFAAHSERYEALNALGVLPIPNRLDDLLYHHLDDLEPVRCTVDMVILSWLDHEVEEGDFSRSLEYRNVQGVSFERDFGELLSHLFNHQTHHRGQVSTLLSQCGQDVGVTDFLMDILEVESSHP